MNLALKKFRMTDQSILSGRIYLFYFAVFIFTLLMLSVYLSISYSHTKRIKLQQLESTSNRINYLLSDAFDETSRLMIYIGKQINHQNYNDLNYINSLLSKTTGKEYKNRNIFSWTLFDWVDANNLQVVNRMEGIIKVPIDMSHRDYTWKSRNEPWTLQLSDPAIGIPSGTWIIPAGVGITDKQNNFLGILTVGFNCRELTEMLLTKTKDDKISFVIVDDNLNYILGSEQFKKSNTNSLVRMGIENLSQAISTENYGLFSIPIKDDDVTYFHYRKMEGTPYTILLGFKYKSFLKDYILSSLPAIFQIMSMGIFTVILVYFSRKKIIDIGRSSAKAKDNYDSHINKRLDVNLDVILQHTDILIRFLKGEINVGVTLQRQIEFLSNISKAASNVKNVDNPYELRTIDLNRVVDISIDIHSLTVLQRNILLRKELKKSSLLINCDELYMKQTVVCLLSFCIEHTPLGKELIISTYSNKEEVVLKISHNCFELNPNDITRINNNLFKRTYSGDIDHTTKLVELHGGKLKIEQTGVLRTLTASFPISKIS